MDSDQIELLAVNCVTDAFAFCRKLKTYIPIKDKEPAWDGHIYISPSKGNYSRIATQVKGKVCKKLPQKKTYPISVLNLKNYKRDGGIVYFVVYIVGDERYPYYHCLAPIDLKRLIKQANGNSSIAVPLYPLGSIDENRENEFIEFYYDCKKQTSLADCKTITLEEAIKKGYPLNYTVHGAKDQSEALLMLGERYHYIYANIGSSENPILMPVGDQPVKLLTLPIINKPVKVGETTFYDDYKDGQTRTERTIIIGDFMTIRVVKGTKSSNVLSEFNPDRLDNFYNQVRFLYYAFTSKGFDLGSEHITFKPIPTTEIKDITEKYNFWTRIVNTLEILHCDLSLIDVNELNDDDIERLKLLTKIILDKQPVSQKQKIDTFSVLEFGSHSVFLIAEKQPDGRYLGSDFFSIVKDACVRCISKDKKTHTILPVYSAVFMREDFPKFVNVDYTYFIESYSRALDYNRDIFSYANQDVLRMIRAYDIQKRKDKRLLKYALELIEWIIKTAPNGDMENIYQLNRFQILKRLNGKLSDSDIDTIVELSDSDMPTKSKWAANILLEDYKRAERYWNKLSLDEQEELKQYPIWHFTTEQKTKIYE